MRPLREDIPIYLAAEGPKNIALATELCQGWLALFYSPHSADLYAEALARAPRDDFEVVATVPLIVADDVDAAADMIRPMYALYFGGMGAREVNFHANVPDPHGLRGRGREDPGRLPRTAARTRPRPRSRPSSSSSSR